ncbi:MAG TPA: hypothetical protein VNB90_04660 [Cytophagaceae bacterium]|nr:hypothetical protein [Cytophagaceae bacterium]
MKKLIHTLLLSSIFMNLQAQDKTNLYGEWKITSEDSLLTLIKVKNDPQDFPRYDWGRFLCFLENGSYQEHASAPCGLDDNRYSYSGKWNFNVKNKTIELASLKAGSKRPDIYHHYTLLSSGVIQLIEVTDKKLVLKIIIPWEKISDKN